MSDAAHWDEMRGLPIRDVAERLVPFGIKWARSGREWKCCCLIHTEKTASMGFDDQKNTWYCHGCKVGGGVVELVQQVMELPIKEAMEWLEESYRKFPREDNKKTDHTKDKAGKKADKPSKKKAVQQDDFDEDLRPESLSDESDAIESEASAEPPKLGKLVKEYLYRDEVGIVRHKTMRYEPKAFRQAAWVDGKWRSSLKDVPTFVYRLPELLEAKPWETIWLAEGEKDAETLVGLGLVATTLPMGAGKWKEEYGEWFRDREVVVVADHDPVDAKRGVRVGLAAACGVAKRLFKYASFVAVLTIPQLWSKCPDKSDITSWVEMVQSGGGMSALDMVDEMETAVRKGKVQGWMYEDCDQNTLARRIVKANRLAYMAACFWTWRDHKWMALSTEKLERLVRDCMEAGGCEITSRELSSVIRLMQSENAWTVAEADRQPSGWLALKNGMLDMMSGEFHAHHPHWRNTVTAGAKHDEKAECPMFLKWLKQQQPDEETQAQLQEIMGYVLGLDINYHAFFFFYGDGGTGKSTFVEIMEALVGYDNRVAVELEELNNAFTRHSLVGKSLYLCSELTHRSFKHIGIIKALTSGDVVPVDVKHREGYSFVPKGRFVMTSNVLANTPDSSAGFERRFVQVTWEVKVARDKMEYGLAKKIKEQELSGILNWAMAGYRRLRARGHFMHTRRSQEATDELLRHRAQVQSFLESYLDVRMVDNGEKGVGHLSHDDLFALYNEWCEENTVVAFYKQKEMFMRELYAKKPEWKKRRGRIRDVSKTGHESRMYVVSGLQTRGAHGEDYL